MKDLFIYIISKFRKCKHYEMYIVGLTNNHSVVPINGDSNDYIRPFVMNTQLYSSVRDARLKYNKENKEQLPIRSDFYDLYDNRIGYLISGQKINTKLHELHNYRLKNKHNNKIYIIDTISIQHYFGFYTKLCIREVGSKSHAVITWSINNCHDPITLDDFNKTHKKYELISIEDIKKEEIKKYSKL